MFGAVLGYFFVSVFAGVSAVLVDNQLLFYISFTYLGMGIVEAIHYMLEDNMRTGKGDNYVFDEG